MSKGRRPQPMQGRRVLITGGSSGIGLACARELTAGGARIVLLARGEEGLRQAAASLDPAPATLSADVTDATAMRAALAAASHLLGGLDVVVANAAAAAYGPFVDMSVDDYRRTIDVALLGNVNTAHAALAHLEPTAGTLVVVGSIAGRLPTPWLAAYTAAKHGLRGFVRSLSAELRALGSPVKVALIAPGPVDTPFWARSRTVDRRLPPRLYGIYRPEDVAREVTRAIASPRTERTVGGLMAALAFVDAIAPNATLRLLGPLARLGWRKRDRRPFEPADALSEPAAQSELRSESLGSRPSLLVRLRDLARIGR
ncbi:MAG: SDR family NAD(P)-dependent oxidoreductase [Actinobacteria bacterium]|nr:SDR family NAD(P)-dependent oxidoreductase [Actinomycetota bacterium]